MRRRVLTAVAATVIAATWREPPPARAVEVAAARQAAGANFFDQLTQFVF